MNGWSFSLMKSAESACRGVWGLRALRWALLSGLSLGSFSIGLAADSAEDIAFFENRIRPVLVENCHACHGADPAKRKGGLRLDTRDGLDQGGDSGAAVVAGDPERSRLIRALRQTDPDLRMPPPKEGRQPLPPAVVADFARWVQRGAVFPGSDSSGGKGAASDAAKHWSFQPVSNPPVPAVRNTAWPRTSVDAFVLASLEAHGVPPAPPADPRMLIRRVSYDLTGLPPTADDVEAFASDPSPDAYARVVDRLLESPHYGERWARHWLDVVRYADTAGETADYPVPNAWRYRNYVIDAFNADKPYDQFLREQIAGDILALQGPPDRFAERMTATGFIAISRRFGFDSENYHHLTLQDTLDTLGQTVLGLSLGCARCHNHKFDPIPSTDYYALYGIFESTRYAFPGSEQKQKRRAMSPLVPPEAAQRQWLNYEQQVARLARLLDQQQLSAPSAILRSLGDLDGDFEMQAAAAGGSKGVLVPPWMCAGMIAVTAEAQSPFKNLHPSGAVGAQILGGTNRYHLGQSLPPGMRGGSGGKVYLNLDFNLEAPTQPSKAGHRLWLGQAGSLPMVEVQFSPEGVTLRSGSAASTLPLPPTASWQNIQLAIDLAGGTATGTMGTPGQRHDFAPISLRAGAGRVLEHLELESFGEAEAPLPGFRVDNIGIQSTPIPPVSNQPAFATGTAGEPNATRVMDEWKALVGIDGSFEFQSDGAAPSKPWGPGPNSVVRISGTSQSPYRNLFPAGRLGVHLPNSGAYNGFGQTLSRAWKAGPTNRLHVAFDFRCGDVSAGGSGSWRHYLGHGPGSSAAVELFFNGSQFFRRSGDTRDAVAALEKNRWYQVRLDLDLGTRRYSGVIATPEQQTPFEGQFASGWDGTIDNTFIDSYGHLGGVKPALDADNFVIQDTPLRPLSEPALVRDDATEEQRARQAETLRQQMAALAQEAEVARKDLERLLVEGPFDLAYGVVEGTPHNAYFQYRGEPEKPGEEIPRGFIRVLGGGTLPAGTTGSGRLELAEWLTRPENPLTARVMVNRIWQYHFGRGLVATPNDFGTRGQRPSDPQLLDHLATQFVRSGWSLKAMHRLLVLSATYQQSSTLAHAGVIPPVEHASFTRRRLSAEEIRDSILAVTGELDPSPGRGHPFPSPTGWGYTQHGPFAAVYDHNQRSIYLMTQRLKRHPFLALFDGADPNASTAERRTTTVPTQSLYFLNDRFVHEKATRLAERLQGADLPEAQQIRLAFRAVLDRNPAPTDQAEAAEFLSDYRARLDDPKNPAAPLAALIRVLFADNEFLHVD